MVDQLTMWQSILHWLIAILIPTIIIELIRKEFNQRGPKLVYYSSAIITHHIVLPKTGDGAQPASSPAQPMWLNSFILTVSNNGNITARNIEISHPQPPQHFQLTPTINHEVIRLEDKDNRRMTIKIPSLGPKETVAISYLFGPVANWSDLLEYVRSEDGLAKKIDMTLNRTFPKWFNMSLLMLCVLGLIFLGVIIWWIYPPIVHMIKWIVNFPRP